MTNGKASILIVDDDDGMARTTAMILRRKGYAVSTAESGSDALELVQQKPFDIIFLDIKMPLMDGVETHQRIKGVRPEAVVVMMTGYAVEDLIQQALHDGAWDILYKPLDFDRVVEIIENARTTRDSALILIVDDDPATCATLKSILAHKGYEVRTAQTGQEAIEATDQTRYDILFIDVKLPAINGLETYLRIRKNDSEAVVVMMTAYREEVEDLVQQALQNHAYACLYKPFDGEELVALVDRIWMNKRAHHRDGAQTA